MNYTELSIDERATLQIGLSHSLSMRAIARLIGRSPSIISREIKRNSNSTGQYSAPQAQQSQCRNRLLCRPKKKLTPESELFELVAYMLRHKFSPDQIAGKLRTMNIPGYEHACVCRETIYNAIYALPMGKLRKELSSAFDKAKQRAGPIQVVWIAAAKYLTWLVFICVRLKLKID